MAPDPEITAALDEGESGAADVAYWLGELRHHLDAMVELTDPSVVPPAWWSHARAADAALRALSELLDD